jgi:hypothetical protein
MAITIPIVLAEQRQELPLLLERVLYDQLICRQAKELP